MWETVTHGDTTKLLYVCSPHSLERPAFVHWASVPLSCGILLRQCVIPGGKLCDPWKSSSSLSPWYTDDCTSTLNFHCVPYRTSRLQSKGVSFILGSRLLNLSPDTLLYNLLEKGLCNKIIKYEKSDILKGRNTSDMGYSPPRIYYGLKITNKELMSISTMKVHR